MTTLAPDSAALVVLEREIERFLYHEARLLDERRFGEWYELFTDDVRYFMPLRRNRLRREQDAELTGGDDLSYFDDDKRFLHSRILRLETGMAWAEDPPSRTRHLVTNVLVDVVEDAPGEYEVASNFLLYRNRLETEVDLFAGCRQDVLRREAGGLRIASRTILLDQNVLLSKNLSVFF